MAELETLVAAAPSAEEGTSTVLRVLVLAELVDPTRLFVTLGEAGAAELMARHDRTARGLLARFNGLEVAKSDGFLLLFERPAEAVGYALAYHQALAELAPEEDRGGSRGATRRRGASMRNASSAGSGTDGSSSRSYAPKGAARPALRVEPQVTGRLRLA